MERYRELRRVAMENATLLWSLSETPEKPAKNFLGPSSSDWKLTIDQEKQLAEDFACITSSRWDPNRVTAVCVEEEQGGLIVRVAANTGDVSATVQNLQGVADEMIQARQKEFTSRLEIRQSMLKRIVQICRTRILTRLKSKHAPKTRKKNKGDGFPPVLVSTIRKCQLHIKEETTKVMALQCRTVAEQLNGVFAQIEGSTDPAKMDNLLVQLLMLAHQLDFAALNAIIEVSPKSVVEPDMRVYLPEVIRKLGRYYQIAVNFTNSARSEHSVFGNIVVMNVRCNNINRRVLNDGVQSFDPIVPRVLSDATLRRFTKGKKTAKQKYEKRLSDNVPKWKVHAEIQLLLFYQINRVDRPPRIIAASKSACYLCNLFLNTHGQFAAPRTHGRIYDKWTLPDFAMEQSSVLKSLNIVVERFNLALEDKIKAICSGQPRHKSHPNESVVGSNYSWTSISTVRALENPGLNAVNRQRPIQTYGLGSSSSTLTSSPAQCEIGDNIQDYEGYSPLPCAAETHFSSSSKSFSEQSSVESNSTVMVRPNETLRRRFSRDETLVVRTSAVHLYISIADALNDKAHGEVQRYDAFSVGIDHYHDGHKAPDPTRKELVVDLDQLHIHRDEVVGVGAAAILNGIVCRSKESEVILTFGLPEVDTELSESAVGVV